MSGVASSLRFAVLRHEGVAEPHFDLLIERAPGAMLAAWRCSVWPIEGRAEMVRLADHRRVYLEYEGEIPGGRGWVRRVDGGVCSVEISNAEWIVSFDGRAGRLVLRAVEGDRWEGEAPSP